MIYKDQLEAVYRLIEKPENWTQGMYACGDGLPERYSDDEWVATDPRACSWCLFGAGLKCGISTSDMWDKITPLAGMPPHTFNDTHTHGEVLDLLKDAINRTPVRP